MLTLYDYLPSQNAYKVRLLLHHLGRDYRTVEVSIFEGEGKEPAYLEINPTGAVPALVLDDGRALAESNAILSYLAEDTEYLPADRYDRAKVAQWLSFEGDYIQSGIATLRHWVQTGKTARRTVEAVQARRELALHTLEILDRILAQREFIATDRYTIADMSIFAYTHKADEAGLLLESYANVCAWIERVRSQDGFLETVYPYSMDPHSSREL